MEISHKSFNEKTHDFYAEGDPIRNLWSAVVLRVLEDLEPSVNKVNKQIRVRRKEVDLSLWFFSDSDSSSLPWICERLEIDIESIRAEAVRRYCNTTGDSPTKQYVKLFKKTKVQESRAKDIIRTVERLRQSLVIEDDLEDEEKKNDSGDNG